MTGDKNSDAKQNSSEKMQLQENLEGLIVATDKALAEAKKDCMDDAVNWAKVHCFNAEACIASDGDITFRVWISDAAPDAHMLQGFVCEYLKRFGIKVSVHTEW